MKIDIIIPVYNHWDLVHSRLRELYSNVPQNTEIIIVDDCSPDNDILDGVNWWRGKTSGKDGPLYGRLFAYRNKENLGFGGTCNRGADIAIKRGADGFCFLSTDVTVMSDFVTNVVTILSLDNQVLIGGELLYNDTGWNVLPNCGVVPYANGWFLATSKEAWQVLGGFDSRFGLFDYEDVDLSTTAWWNGIKLVPVGAKLRHAGGKSVNAAHPDRVKHTLRNQGVWQDKWYSRAEELKKKIYG